MQAHKFSISETLGSQAKFEIPFFQRNYVWKKDMWERYWETMEAVSSDNFCQDYFLGAIVLKQKQNELKDGDIRTVIDGQQRLITTFLFLKSICKRQGKIDILERYTCIPGFESEEKEKKLLVARDDKEMFNSILYDKTSNASDKSNRISNCFEYFSKKEGVEKINLNKILNKICFVVINVDANQDEQQIFDTLNSLGIGLTTAELVKNDLFRSRCKQDIEDYDRYWKDIFEGNEREFWDSTIGTGHGKKPNIEVFFQAFFDVYNKNSQSADYDNAGGLAKKYKIFFKNNKIEAESKERKAFLKSLKEYAEIYRDNINYQSILYDFDFIYPMDRINVVIHGMNNTTIIPYILYVLKTFPAVPSEKNGDLKKSLKSIPPEQIKLLLLIESYIVRRAICKASTKNYNKFFPWLLHNGCCDSKKLERHMYKLMKDNNPTNRFPKGEQLNESFLGDEGKLSSKNIKAILYLLEHSLAQDEDALELKSLNSYQVEHILPQSWENNWKNFGSHITNDYEREDYVNRYVIKMGNLSIITPKLNPAISNSNWTTKKKGPEKNRSKGLEKHAKGIKSFDKDEYLGAEEWTEKQIDARTKELLGVALKIWPEPMADGKVTTS